MPRHIIQNARIFTADERRFADALVIDGDRFLYVGNGETARRVAGADASTEDLGGALVLPGFVDGHAHVVGTGEVASFVDLWGADSLAEIQRRITAGAAADPGAPRVRAHGFQHGAVPGGVPHRLLLDEVIPDRPVYVQAYDFHSIWLNTAALVECGITDETPDTPGGTIHRDPDGTATGYIDETAMHRHVWPFLDGQVTDATRDADLQAVLAGYRERGVTAATDMAMNPADLAALERAERDGTLTARIAAHWRVQPTGSEAENLAQVEEVKALAAAYTGDLLRVIGIKVMIDGTVDGCTAAIGFPYADGSTAAPIWSLEELAPVVVAADAAGLQVAMHAIGDEAVRIGIAAVEAAVAANGPIPRRHRIEHLEVVDRADIDRLAALGITASMQPVHADPAIQANWRARLGDASRIDYGFPWTEMVDAGAPLVFGTDSPTADFDPLPNMFVAATRRSALDPTLPANTPQFAVPLIQSIEHATRDAARASRAEHRYGRIAAGLSADFIVLDRDVTQLAPDELLQASVTRTVLGGRTVHTR